MQNKMWRSTDRRIPPYGSAEDRREHEYRSDRPPPPRSPRHQRGPRHYSNNTRPGPPAQWHRSRPHSPHHHQHPTEPHGSRSTGSTSSHRYYAPRPRQEFFSDGSHGRRPYPRENRPREDYVKLCPKCQNFSLNLRVCTNCGQELRESAKLFRNPSAVNANLKNTIDEVERSQIGPDLKPMLPATGEVLASVVKSNALNLVLRSPPSYEVIRMTPNGPVAVNVPEKTSTPSTSTNNADNPEGCRTSLSTELHSISIVDEPHSNTSHSPEIIEILSPLRPSPPSNKDRTSSPEKSNQAVFDTAGRTNSSKISRNRKITQKGRNLKLIFIPSDDEEDLRSSKSNDKDQQPSPKVPKESELEMARKAQDPTPPADEIQTNTGNKSKRRKKHSSLCENSDDNYESTLEDRRALEPAVGTSDKCVPSTSKRTTETDQDQGHDPLKKDSDSVRLCHACDSYSFSLENCSLCSTAFKKRNPQVNPVVKLNTLTKVQLKSVHYASRSENLTSASNAKRSPSPSPSPSPPLISIADVLDHENVGVDDQNLLANVDEAQELPKDDVEPTITRGTEEAREPTGLIWEGVTYSDNNFSLISGSLILGPNGNPIRSNISGGVPHVRQCSKCFKIGSDLTHCNICKKKFTKKIPVWREADVTNEQRAESEKNHQAYLAEQLQIEDEKIAEKLKKMAHMLHRQKLQKLGLLNETDNAPMPPAPANNNVPDTDNDNRRNRKRKTSDGDG